MYSIDTITFKGTTIFKGHSSHTISRRTLGLHPELFGSDGTVSSEPNTRVLGLISDLLDHRATFLRA